MKARDPRQVWHSGIAESEDLVHWKRVADVDVRTLTGERLVGVRPAEQRAARAELHAEEHGREGERALRDQSEDLFDLVHDFPFCSNSRSR